MTQQINLYDPKFRRQEKPFSSKSIGYALAAVVLGLGALSVYGAMGVRNAEQLAADSARQLATEREKLVQLGGKLGPQARSKALEVEVTRLEGEVKARQNVLSALGTGGLGNTEGFSEFMAALGRQTVPGVWLTAVKIGEEGNDLEVLGRALRPDLVPAYLRALNNEPMMRGRRVTEMKLAAKSSAPVAATPGVAPKPQAAPERFVEFTLTAPLRLPEAAKGDASKGEKK
jgi:Tfp pilus assembly protein PilN